jgi:hypothetical protein
MNQLTAHLARGITGVTLIGWALTYADTQPLLAAAAGIMAVVALRGCPACWVFGLWDRMRHH